MDYENLYEIQCHNRERADAQVYHSVIGRDLDLLEMQQSCYYLHQLLAGPRSHIFGGDYILNYRSEWQRHEIKQYINKHQ